MKGQKRKKQPFYNAPALEKGLDILEFLSVQTVACSQVKIAQSLGRSHSEIYRMLACMERRGYVQKEEASGNYRITLRLYELAHRQNSTALLRHAALSPMDVLVEETGHSCHLSVQHGSFLLVLMERMPDRRICLAVGEGSVFPLSQTASGKVLLSRMPDQFMCQVLSNDTYYQSVEIMERNAIKATAAEIRKAGYLVVESKLTQGAIDIAVPIGLDNTNSAAVIDIPLILEGADTTLEMEKLLKMAQACATKINQNLGIKL